MKRSGILLFSLFLCISVCAQKKQGGVSSKPVVIVSTDTTLKYYWNYPEEKWFLSARVINRYDQNKNVVSILAEGYDSTANVWNNISLATYEYDKNGNNTYIRLERYSHKWHNSYQQFFEYDKKKNMTGLLHQTWIIADERWINKDKSKLSYNSNNKVISHQTHYWDKETNDWTNSFNTRIAYDKDTTRSAASTESWNKQSSKWTHHSKAYIVNIYNADKQLLSRTTHSYPPNKPDYVHQLINTYDANKNLLMTSESAKDSLTNQWISWNKTEYTYDEKNNLILSTNQLWDEKRNAWMNREKINYLYKNDLVLSAKEVFYFDHEKGKWVGSEREEYQKR